MIHTLVIAACHEGKSHRLGNITVGEPSQQHHLNQSPQGVMPAGGLLGCMYLLMCWGEKNSTLLLWNSYQECIT